MSTNLLDVQRVRQGQNHLSLSGEGWASFLGVVTTGCSPLPVGGHVQVALAGAPHFILLHQERPEQAHGRFAVGEDADDALAAADLLMEPLLAVRRPQPRAIGRRQRQDRCGIVEASFQGGDSRGSRLGVVGDETGEQEACGLHVGRLKDGAHAGMDLLVEGFGRRVGDSGRAVHLAALPRCALNLNAYRSDQAAVVVGGGRR